MYLLSELLDDKLNGRINHNWDIVFPAGVSRLSL